MTTKQRVQNKKSKLQDLKEWANRWSLYPRIRAANFAHKIIRDVLLGEHEVFSILAQAGAVGCSVTHVQRNMKTPCPLSNASRLLGQLLNLQLVKVHKESRLHIYTANFERALALQLQIERAAALMGLQQQQAEISFVGRQLAALALPAAFIAWSNIVLHGALTVGDVQGLLECEQSDASRVLARLREAGLVVSERRPGNHMLYKTPAHVEAEKYMQGLEIIFAAYKKEL